MKNGMSKRSMDSAQPNVSDLRSYEHYISDHYSPLGMFIWTQHNDQLPVGRFAQLVEHCTCAVACEFLEKSMVFLVSLNLH